MRSPAELRVELAEGLDSVLDQYAVPGAAVMVQAEDDGFILTGGVASLRTRVPVTADTMFLIGSITKVYTATLVMMLADRGLIELDANVRRYLPELRLADASAMDVMTVRQLISHTSGIDENLGLVFGRDDDCLARFVERGQELPQLHPPGELFSYCNSGFILAGRIIEVVTGRPFDRALADLLVKPLNLAGTVMLPEEAILNPVAVGHLPTRDGVEVTSIWALPRAVGPAGGVCSSVADLIAFGRAHLDPDFQTVGESPLLSDGARRDMQKPQALLYDVTRGSAQGLGWRLWETDAGQLLGHFGGNIGQYCQLSIVPDRGLALAVLTNSFAGAPVYEWVAGIVLEGILGSHNDGGGSVSAASRDLTTFAGTYESFHDTINVEVRGDELLMTSTPSPNWINKLYSAEKVSGPLSPVGDSVFRTAAESLYGEAETRVVFLQFDGGRPAYLHHGDYAYRRVDA